MFDHPRLKIGDEMVAVMGDPHLGRRWLNGVPLHRRGERETMVEEAFLANLRKVDEDVDSFHVCMGDLFDRPNVPPSVVALAADAYINVGANNPDTAFVVIRGNHEASRDLEAVTSFDLFRRIVEGAPNIFVVADQPELISHRGLDLLFVPYHFEHTGAELLAEFEGRADAAFGHWDVLEVGNPHNLIPLAKLRSLTNGPIVTGHDHKRREQDGVIVTGSLQPFAHGEDWTGEMYRTVPLAELPSLGDTRNMCVRVVLKDGETMPSDIDALHVSSIREGQPDVETLEVDFGGLDMGKLFHEVMAANGVGETLTNILYEKYRSRA